MNRHYDRHFRRTYPGRISAYDFEPDPFTTSARDRAVFWSVVAICVVLAAALHYVK